LVMYFCISGFEDKFWCKRSLRAKLTSFDVLVSWNLEYQYIKGLLINLDGYIRPCTNP
jgi:hypothetical protein